MPGGDTILMGRERYMPLSQVKKWLMAMGEEDGEDDLGSFVPHSLAPPIKFEIIPTRTCGE
jgi:hypothetical protein